MEMVEEQLQKQRQTNGCLTLMMCGRQWQWEGWGDQIYTLNGPQLLLPPLSPLMVSTYCPLHTQPSTWQSSLLQKVFEARNCVQTFSIFPTFQHRIWHKWISNKCLLVQMWVFCTQNSEKDPLDAISSPSWVSLLFDRVLISSYLFWQLKAYHNCSS